MKDYWNFPLTASEIDHTLGIQFRFSVTFCDSLIDVEKKSIPVQHTLALTFGLRVAFELIGNSSTACSVIDFMFRVDGVLSVL